MHPEIIPCAACAVKVLWQHHKAALVLAAPVSAMCSLWSRGILLRAALSWHCLSLHLRLPPAQGQGGFVPPPDTDAEPGADLLLYIPIPSSLREQDSKSGDQIGFSAPKGCTDNFSGLSFWAACFAVARKTKIRFLKSPFCVLNSYNKICAVFIFWFLLTAQWSSSKEMHFWGHRGDAIRIIK